MSDSEDSSDTNLHRYAAYRQRLLSAVPNERAHPGQTYQGRISDRARRLQGSSAVRSGGTADAISTGGTTWPMADRTILDTTPGATTSRTSSVRAYSVGSTISAPSGTSGAARLPSSPARPCTTIPMTSISSRTHRSTQTSSTSSRRPEPPTAGRVMAVANDESRQIVGTIEGDVITHNTNNTYNNRVSTLGQITGAAILGVGVLAGTYISGTPPKPNPGGPEPGREIRFPHFEVARNPEKFFTLGRVFDVLWARPQDAVPDYIPTYVRSYSADGETVFSEFRRLVVVKPGRKDSRRCSCISIITYGELGVSNPGLRKSEHGIVYVGKECPAPTLAERPKQHEAGLQPLPVRLIADHTNIALEPVSRLNYGNLYIAENNVKVRPFGKVHPRSMTALQAQFQTVAFSKRHAGSPGATPGTMEHERQKCMLKKYMNAVSVLVQRGLTRQQALDRVRSTIEEGRQHGYSDERILEILMGARIREERSGRNDESDGSGEDDQDDEDDEDDDGDED